jgi:hypothetical protein
MRQYHSKVLSRVYLWTFSSIYRVLLSSILLGAILAAAALAFAPWLFFIAAFVILLTIGLVGFQVKQSEAILDYPGIDRFFQQVPCYLSILNTDLRIIRSNKLFRADFGDRTGEKCHVVYKQ